MSCFVEFLTCSANASCCYLGSREVVFALLGAAFTLLLPAQTGARRTSGECRDQTAEVWPTRRRRLSSPKVRDGRLNFSFAVLVASLLCGAGVRAAKEVAQGPFSVKLTRQQMPLDTSGGVIYHKSAYYGEVQIGTPEPQTFSVVIDTGSGHLVLPSAFCRSETCLAHRRYRSKLSQTAIHIDADGTRVVPGEPRDEITVNFGTGEVSGVFVQDEVCLGGVHVVSEREHQAVVASSFLAVDVAAFDGGNATSQNASGDLVEPPAMRSCVNLRVIAATEMTADPFSDFAFDGILGLSLDGLSQTPEFNFLNVASASGAWKALPGLEQAFSIFLAKSDAEESEITFGGWREDHLRPGAEVQWCNVKDADMGYWQVEVFDIAVNGVRLDFCKNGCRAIVDTGTSLLGVPSALGIELEHLLYHNASEDGRCDGMGPVLEIDLGTTTLSLNPADYASLDSYDADNDVRKGVELEVNGDPLRPLPLSFFQPPKPKSKVQGCMPMLAHMDLPDPLHPRTLILGEPVLQRYYATFDSGAKRVGFGEAYHVSNLQNSDMPATF